MEFTNLVQMTAYMEDKFTSDSFKAVAHPLEEFGPVVMFAIGWAPKKKGTAFPEGGYMWCSTKGVTSAVIQ